jgi:2,3-bisphosphoglycerate-independent phosphoglycerate mutase
MMKNSRTLSCAIRKSYRKGEDDETLEPIVLTDENKRPFGRIRAGDSVIFYNIRGEREIELTESLTDPNFDKFPVEKALNLNFATMIEYSKDLNVRVAFPPDDILRDTLSETLSRHQFRQVKITEAEKAVHVGYFLNGKYTDSLPGEDRVVVPTRKDVALFDEAPEMSSAEIANVTIRKIRDRRYHLVVTNFPNVDVVGHIENEAAVIKAVEIVDYQMGRVVEEALEEGVTVIITADHGTAERWRYPDGTIDTGHTLSPVPFILIHDRHRVSLQKEGELTDVAPTILTLFGLPVPEVMTGHPLLHDTTARAKRILLIILDGWGFNAETEGNLIAQARTPVMDRLQALYSMSILNASGAAVGLPDKTVGNSEAGHLHLGAGRKILSDRVKIDRAISDGSFFTNPAFLQVMEAAASSGTSLHLLGIVSFFSSHGSVRHLTALMDMAAKSGVKDVFIHAMLGRRGEMPESGANYVETIEKKAVESGVGKVVSVIGRYWSMDREENWDRIEKTYRMLVNGRGTLAPERS